MSLHICNLIRFYNRALRIRTRKWLSPKNVSRPCAKQEDVRQTPKDGHAEDTDSFHLQPRKTTNIDVIVEKNI